MIRAFRRVLQYFTIYRLCLVEVIHVNTVIIIVFKSPRWSFQITCFVQQIGVQWYMHCFQTVQHRAFGSVCIPCDPNNYCQNSLFTVCLLLTLETEILERKFCLESFGSAPVVAGRLSQVSQAHVVSLPSNGKHKWVTWAGGSHDI